MIAALFVSDPTNQFCNLFYASLKFTIAKHLIAGQKVDFDLILRKMSADLARLELATYSMLGRRDNHYTTGLCPLPLAYEFL